MCVCVCCVFSSHSFWTSSSLDVPAGVTQEEGHTGFVIHLLSAVHALIFLARRIQPFLSLVDREVECCIIIIIIINDTLARSLEPVVTECKEHTIHTQTQIVASRKPKEIKHTHEGEANPPHNQHKSPIELQQC